VCTRKFRRLGNTGPELYERVLRGCKGLAPIREYTLSADWGDNGARYSGKVAPWTKKVRDIGQYENI